VITAEVEAAGLRVRAVDVVDVTGTAERGARRLAEGFCLGSPMRFEIAGRDATRLDEAVDAVDRALMDRYGGGPVRTDLRALVVTAA